MAGGNFDAPDSGQGRGGKSYKKPAQRGVHIDMTPMVDVIMLLLTFFMLTTTLSAPQLMNINLPKGDVNKDKVKLAANNILFVRVTDKNEVFVSRGKEDGSESNAEKIGMKELSPKLETEHKINEETVIILRFDRKAKYSSLVDVFDEINRAKIKDRRYAIQPMEETDKEFLKAFGGY